MGTSITASEANRNFSEVLRKVEHGESIAVTRHGRTVARIVPATMQADEHQARADRRQAYLERAAQRPVMQIGPWTRDELYER
jgi:prevent-host-death family protein